MKLMSNNTTGLFEVPFNAGDVLFIDSSHVSKMGSDVNHILFNVLPLLKSGVFIHFHDMFYPFIYPKSWTEQGRFWNETFLLRAFLQNNKDFTIQFWGNFLHVRYVRFLNLILSFNKFTNYISHISNAQ